MKTTAAIDINIIIKDISIEGVAAIIDDFEHGKAVNKAKIESIVKHTESFKQLQKMEDKIKSSKEKLTSLVAASMWQAGEKKGVYTKDHFVRFLEKEKEKKEQDKDKAVAMTL